MHNSSPPFRLSGSRSDLHIKIATVMLGETMPSTRECRLKSCQTRSNKSTAGRMSEWAHALMYLCTQGVADVIRDTRELGWRNRLVFIRRWLRDQCATYFATRWDQRNNVDTGGWIDLKNLAVVGENREHGRSAVSTPPSAFRSIARYFPKDCAEYTFLDIGCGKGRALLIALNYGFLRVIGVEFSSYLCDVARKNLNHFPHRGSHTDFCVVNEDATKYHLPDGNLVIFLFAPFSPIIFRMFLSNVSRSYAMRPRNIILIIASFSKSVMVELANEVGDHSILSQRAKGVTSTFSVDSHGRFHYSIFESVVASSALSTELSQTLG
jgi:SAM-dependent methyltransferase